MRKVGLINSASYGKKLWEEVQKQRPELREKPHIRMWRGKWECLSRGVNHFGNSPESVYANWRNYLNLIKGSLWRGR